MAFGWSEAQKLIPSSDFLNSPFNFPKDEINAETVEFLEPLQDMPDLNLEGTKKLSGDVAGLVSWVGTMVIIF